MTKLLAIFIFTSYCMTSYAALEKIQDIIKDPVISRRCKSLLRHRSEKIDIKQKLSAMLLKNQKLTKKLNPQQKVTKTRLLLNKTQIKNNIRLTSLRIKSMEENIVRRGCPGITL